MRLISDKNADKVKDEVATVHAMKAHGGRIGITPPILNLGSRGSSVANNTHRPFLLPRKNSVASEQENGWAPEQVWASWRTEPLAIAGNKKLIP